MFYNVVVLWKVAFYVYEEFRHEIQKLTKKATSFSLAKYSNFFYTVLPPVILFFLFPLIPKTDSIQLIFLVAFLKG